MAKYRQINGIIHPSDAKEAADDIIFERYTNPVHQKFKEQATAAGYEVSHYNGRFFYSGPAVSVANEDEFHELVRVTTVRLQRDNLGLGWIVYPK